MTHQPPIEQGEQTALDQVRTDEYSRARFLKMVGGAGAVGAMGLLLAACGDDDTDTKKTTSTADDKTATDTKSDDTMSGDSGDLAIVNYALTLEYLEADFYAKVIDSGLFKGADLESIKIIGDHEQQHVDALLATAKSLGTPATKPETTFPLEDAKSVLELAATVENLGAAAYLGQAGNIKSLDILAAALAIHSVEARHAAALNTLIGKPFTPDGPFAKPADMETVLAAVKPFIVA